MSNFIQLHMLTSYPPANLNRDDLGRPKTVIMGGTQRLRISSQSLKRAWRTSEQFKEALDGHIGIRTKGMGTKIFKQLTGGGIKEKDAKKWAKEIAEQFGKLKKDSLDIEQLTHFSPEEDREIEALTKILIEKNRGAEENELNLLRKNHKAVDIAMFGRMLAKKPQFNTEAAIQVAHAVSVHKVAVEDDFFTAVDDLNSGEDDMGAGHMGETEFASGLFYLYICIDSDSLCKNLDNDKDLTNKAIRALAESAATVAPTGKQNSFASRAYASYILAEKGRRQPRSLSVAFLKAVSGTDILPDAIKSLEVTRERMDTVYGVLNEPFHTLNAYSGNGTLSNLLDFLTGVSQS